MAKAIKEKVWMNTEVKSERGQNDFEKGSIHSELPPNTRAPHTQRHICLLFSYVNE